jgi:hypothetical protein
MGWLLARSHLHTPLSVPHPAMALEALSLVSTSCPRPGSRPSALPSTPGSSRRFGFRRGGSAILRNTLIRVFFRKHRRTRKGDRLRRNPVEVLRPRHCGSTRRLYWNAHQDQAHRASSIRHAGDYLHRLAARQDPDVTKTIEPAQATSYRYSSLTRIRTLP